MGGKSATYITQNKTTVFHDFWTRKFLLPEESAEDYREATEAERTKLQAIRDAWVRPPQVFIDKWNEACYGGDGRTFYDCICDLASWGRYNEDTGYFELNGITDITYEDALRIMDYGHLDMNIPMAFCGSRIRTHLPMRNGGTHTAGDYALCNMVKAFDLSEVEVINVCVPKGQFNPHGRQHMFHVFGRADKLRKVIGRIILPWTWVQNKVPFHMLFQNPQKLEHVELCLPWADGFDMSRAQSLDLWSWQKLIELKTAGTCSITVHADVYAKLTGDTTNAAAAQLSADELAEWMALVETAAEKNITFTT